jgi:CRP-like cAMP-binding protein
MPDLLPQPVDRPEQPRLHALLTGDTPDLRPSPMVAVSSPYEAELGLYAAITEKAARHPGPSPTVSIRTIPARRAISHPTEWSQSVPVVCRGWATSSLALPDGRRQILSFLLPGDFACSASLFEPISGRLVEAITEVTYCNFQRSELKAFLFAHPDLLEILTKTWIEERKQADQLAVDLGRRTAAERIARLILSLTERLARRGLVQDNNTMEFPLRQHHIADATGLTPVHVSKVISDLRRRGLIEISERTLTILDLAGLRCAAILR